MSCSTIAFTPIILRSRLHLLTERRICNTRGTRTFRVENAHRKWAIAQMEKQLREKKQS